MARNNNAFSLGPMLEKEKLLQMGATMRTGSISLGLSSKLLRRTMFSKNLSQPLPLRRHRRTIRTSMRLKWMTTPQYNA